MSNEVLLSVALVASAVGAGIIAYTKLLKKKLKRFVLRNEKIEKYFKEKQE